MVMGKTSIGRVNILSPSNIFMTISLEECTASVVTFNSSEEAETNFLLRDLS